MDPSLDYDVSDELECGIDCLRGSYEGCIHRRPTRRCRRISIKVGTTLLRATMAAASTLCLLTAAYARAGTVDYLMVPSAAMGRDIPVAFMAEGPHAVYLLDAFDAGDAVSTWVSAGDSMNTLAGKGISVVAPAGGAYILYTDWEQDPSRQ